MAVWMIRDTRIFKYEYKHGNERTSIIYNEVFRDISAKMQFSIDDRLALVTL